MLRTRDDACFLNTQDRLICRFPGEEGISSEAFPVTSALRNAPHVHHWAELNVHTFSSVLLSHEQSTLPHQSTIPACCCIYACRECSCEIGVAHTQRRVLQTQAGPASSVPRDWSGISLQLRLDYFHSMYPGVQKYAQHTLLAAPKITVGKISYKLMASI